MECLPVDTTPVVEYDDAGNVRSAHDEETAESKERRHRENVRMFNEMMDTEANPGEYDENIRYGGPREDESETVSRSSSSKRGSRTQKKSAGTAGAEANDGKSNDPKTKRKKSFTRTRRKKKSHASAPPKKSADMGNSSSASSKGKRSSASGVRGIPGVNDTIAAPVVGIRPYMPFVSQKSLERSGTYYISPSYLCNSRLRPNKPHDIVLEYFEKRFELHGLPREFARLVVPEWAIEKFDRHVSGWLWCGRDHPYVWYPYEIRSDESLDDYQIYCTLVSRVDFLERLISDTRIPHTVRAHLVMIQDTHQYLILWMDKTSCYRDDDLIRPASFDERDFVPYRPDGAERCGIMSPSLMEMWCNLSDVMREARKFKKMPQFWDPAQAEFGITTYYDLFMPRYELIFHQGEIPDLSLFIPYIGLYGRTRKNSIPFKDKDMIEVIELLMKAIGQPMKLRWFHGISSEKSARIPWVRDLMQRMIFASLGGYYWGDSFDASEPSTSYYLRRNLYQWLGFEPPTIEEFCGWIRRHEIPDATGTLSLQMHHKQVCLNCVKMGLFVVIDADLALRDYLNSVYEHRKMRDKVFQSMREARGMMDDCFFGYGPRWERFQRMYDNYYLVAQANALRSIVEATKKREWSDARKTIKSKGVVDDTNRAVDDDDESDDERPIGGEGGGNMNGSRTGRKASTSARRRKNVTEAKPMKICAGVVMPKKPISKKSRSDDDETIDRLIDEHEESFKALRLDEFDEVDLYNDEDPERRSLMKKIKAGRALRDKVPRNRRRAPEERWVFVTQHYARTRSAVLRYVLDLVYRFGEAVREGCTNLSFNINALAKVMQTRSTWNARRRWETEYPDINTYDIRDWSVSGVLRMLSSGTTLRNFGECAVEFTHLFDVLFWPEIHASTTVREALDILRGKGRNMIVHLWTIIGVRTNGRDGGFVRFGRREKLHEETYLSEAERCFNLYAGEDPEGFVNSDHRNFFWKLHGRSVVETGEVCQCPACSGNGVTARGEYRAFQRMIASSEYGAIMLNYTILDGMEHLLQAGYQKNLQYMYRTGGTTFVQCIVRSFDVALEDGKNDEELVRITESITPSERRILAGVAAHGQPWQKPSFMWMALPPLDCEWKAMCSIALAGSVYDTDTYPVDARSIIPKMIKAYKRTAVLVGWYAHEVNIRANTRVFTLPFEVTLRQLYTAHERFNLVGRGEVLPSTVGRFFYCPYHATVNACMVNLNAKNSAAGGGNLSNNANRHSLANVGAVSAMGPIQIALEAGEFRVLCNPSTKRSKARARGSIHEARKKAHQPESWHGNHGSDPVPGTPDILRGSPTIQDPEGADDSVLDRVIQHVDEEECSDDDDDDDEMLGDDDDDEIDGKSADPRVNKERQRKYRMARRRHQDTLCHEPLREINLIGRILVTGEQMYAICMYCFTLTKICRESFDHGGIACGVCTERVDELLPKHLAPYLRFQCLMCPRNTLYEAHEVASYVVYDDTQPFSSGKRGWRRIFLCTSTNFPHNRHHIGAIYETTMISHLKEYISGRTWMLVREETIDGVTVKRPYMVPASNRAGHRRTPHVH